MRSAVFPALLLAGGLLLGSVTLAHADYACGQYIGNSPRPEVVAPNDAWKLAERYASGCPGAMVVRGDGASMEPLYGHGTILVVAPVQYAQLRRGATVVYLNASGRMVTHVLVARVREGWRAVGLNNAWPDRNPVRAENLVGIVVKAFQPDATRRAL